MRPAIPELSGLPARRPGSQAVAPHGQRRLAVISNRPIGAEKLAAGRPDEHLEKAGTPMGNRETGKTPDAQSSHDEDSPREGLIASTSLKGKARKENLPTAKSARAVYEENRLYHGTGGKSKHSIRANGFSRAHKIDGGSAAASSAWSTESRDENKPSYHYLTTERRRADRYAYAAESDSPAIVRTIGVRHDLPLEHIMGVDRTQSDIPTQYIVGSKHSDPGPESATFQKALERANIDVSLQEAGRLLRDVQSDSESDFSSDDDTESK
jgi:type III effector protein AvrRpm1